VSIRFLLIDHHIFTQNTLLCSSTALHQVKFMSTGSPGGFQRNHRSLCMVSCHYFSQISGKLYIHPTRFWRLDSWAWAFQSFRMLWLNLDLAFWKQKL